MRLKCVLVARELIEGALTKGNRTRSFAVIEGIPEGAKLISAHSIPNPFERMKRVQIDTVVLTFEHESFPEAGVGSGYAPETLEVKLRTVEE